MFETVRVIDGTGADPIPRVSVEVTNGVISWIGEETARPKRHVHQEDIQGDGLTLIPGMMDCHEHFTGNGGLDNMNHLTGDTAEVFTLKAAANARRALMGGVTSARDVGSRFGVNILLARESAAGSILGPRIIAAGEWLQFPGTWPPGLTRLTETEEDMMLAIREMIDRGAGLIKIGTNGRRADGELYCTFSPETLRMAVRTAHEAGLKIAAHSWGLPANRQSVEAGVDSIEHGTHLDEETCRLMAEKGTYLVTYPISLAHVTVPLRTGAYGRGRKGLTPGDVGDYPSQLSKGHADGSKDSYWLRCRGLPRPPWLHRQRDRGNGRRRHEPKDGPGVLHQGSGEPAGHP